MTYQQALAFVEETKKYGSILGLDSIRALMKELGDVQEDLSTIHIAGTNGKGSVGAMLQAVLEEAGLKVGRYSSPGSLFLSGNLADKRKSSFRRSIRCLDGKSKDSLSYTDRKRTSASDLL